jgi:hypothetical protein
LCTHAFQLLRYLSYLQLSHLCLLDGLPHPLQTSSHRRSTTKPLLKPLRLCRFKFWPALTCSSLNCALCWYTILLEFHSAL